MIRNIFTTALRHLKKNKLFMAINVLSLSIGISATLVIFLMIHHDYSFDKHIPHPDRVYRVVSDGDIRNAGIPTPLVNVMSEELSGIEVLSPLFRVYNAKVKIESDSSANAKVYPKEKGMVYTNSRYFKIYPHQWLAGNAQLLDQPNKVVLTEKRLLQYFPNISPDEAIGKTLVVSDSILMEVAGVVQEQTENSDFKFDAFLSYATIPTNESLKTIVGWDEWGNYNDSYQCLILLHEGTKSEGIETAIAGLISKYKKDNLKDNFILQPLEDVHFNSDFNYAAVKASTLRNLILLAVFLLALGAINFINLSTAQSIERAKEIGIRKTLGSNKSALVKQFLAETFIVTFIATILSILLLPILLRAFEGFVPDGIGFDQFPIGEVIAFLSIQLLIVTILAGFYPAWIMTNYSPILALKNQASKNSALTRSAVIRKGLTVFQFVIAQIFLISVLVVTKQINFAVNKDMGFRREAIINFYIPDFFYSQGSTNPEVLKNKLEEIPELAAVSLGNQSPAFSGSMKSSMPYDDLKDETLSFDARNGDDHFLEVYNIPLVAGRNIRLLDSTSEALINEKMLEILQVQTPEEALGKTFNNGHYTVVGVMKDFNIASVHAPIRPTMYWGTNNGYVMHIALDKDHPQSWKNAIAKMTTAFKSVYPDYEFEYTFLDDTVKKFYNQELKLSKLLKWAVGLSILIAGLGLFGLALFITNRRTKEIGIRKVLGANISQIVFLLVKNLLGLVLIACAIAFPIAWYFMHQWLADFAYKTNISWWIFAGAALGMLAVAALVLSAKSIQAAMANPVDSLRDE